MNRRDSTRAYAQQHHCNISDADLDRALPQNPESMVTIASCIGIHWRNIRPHLGLTEADAEDIVAERGGVNQMASRMLTIWRTRRGQDAKLWVLLDACSRANTRAAIDSICERRDTIFGPPPTPTSISPVPQPQPVQSPPQPVQLPPPPSPPPTPTSSIVPPTGSFVHKFKKRWFRTKQSGGSEIDASLDPGTREDYKTNFLPGIDTAGETQVIIESNKKLLFDWKNYGLKLGIPEDALPHKLDQCTLTIRALTSGQFKLPPDCTLVSTVYQIEAHVKFARPLTLEIQHCSLYEKHDSSSCSFVIADSSKEELPYRFKVLQGGIFSPDYIYGSISLDHFSFIGIVRRIRGFFSPRSTPLRYCAQLYRICQYNTTTDWGLHFVMTKDLESEITVVKQKLEAEYSNMEVDGQFPIEFNDDEITLSIPEGLKIEGWNISCQHHPSITKAEVDHFRRRSGGVPGCRLRIHWTRQHEPVYFEYKVILNGAKSPRNYFTIVYPPLQTKDVAQATMRAPIYRRPMEFESGRETLQYKRVFNTHDLIISTLADSVSVETLAGKLRINHLIGADIYREARGTERTTSKISHIIDAVLSKVELNPANYDKFIDVLQGFGDLGDLIDHIERAA